MSDDARLPRQLAFFGVAALVIVAPFEPLQPIVSLPAQSITLVELVMALTIGAWAIAATATRADRAGGIPLVWPWLLLLATLTISALAAPDHQANALRTVARLAAAFGVCVVTVQAVATRDRLIRVVVIAVAVGTVVAALAILEYGNGRTTRAWLNTFRDGVRVVGGQVRASGTLQYPTIASMYLEIVFAFAVGLLVLAADRRRWGLAILAGIAGAVIVEGVVVTFTRGGLVTLVATLAIVAVWRVMTRGFDRGFAVVAAMGLVVATSIIVSRSSESLWLRLTSEGRDHWYRASFSAPAEIAMTTGGFDHIPITVTNTGRLTWRPVSDAPFKVAYHWIDADSERVVHYDGVRTDLPGPVAPGQSAALTMYVDAPHLPGRFRLVWDVVQEGRLWFGTEPSAEMVWTLATVTGTPTTPRPSRRAPPVLPAKTTVVGRSLLWKTALRMTAAAPILGVGPDNFRLRYGDLANIPTADPRVHSNNMYLEILTGGGLVGALAFAWFGWSTMRAIRDGSRLVGADTTPVYAGITAALAAIAIHGLVDSFLTFTPLYVLMAVTVALAVSPVAWRRGTNAHRV